MSVEEDMSLEDMSWQEEMHHKLTRHLIMLPPTVIPPESGSDTMDSSRLKLPTKETSLSALAPDDVRNLYFKDCIVYLGVGLDWSDRQQMIDAMYFEWFPHRDREQDLNRGSFFAGFLNATKLKHGLTQLARFHFESLCPRLKELQPEVLEKEKFRYDHGFGMPREKGLFKLRQSFDQTFLVVDQENWRDGICVVTKDKRVAMDIGEVGEELDVEGSGKVKVARAKLESVMKAVVADDNERKKENREWSGYYGKWCGGENEGPPTRFGGCVEIPKTV